MTKIVSLKNRKTVKKTIFYNGIIGIKELHKDALRELVSALGHLRWADRARVVASAWLNDGIKLRCPRLYLSAVIVLHTCGTVVKYLDASCKSSDLLTLYKKRQIVFCMRRNVFSAVGNLRFPVTASKTLYHINKPLGLQPLTGKRQPFSGSGTMFSQASEIFDFRTCGGQIAHAS